MRNYILAALLLLGNLPGKACDACGCAGMGLGLGNWIVTNQHYAGINYSFRQFSTNNTADRYHQWQATFLYSLNDRWQLKASLPYVFAESNVSNEQSQPLNGLADATVEVKYLLLDHISEKNTHQLQLSVGLNLPTGRFIDREGSLLAQNFQVGTGSWDYQAGLRYQWSAEKWILAVSSLYRVNTLNGYAYKFGNQLINEVNLGYKINRQESEFALIPILGFSYERFERDVNSRGYYQYNTGSNAAYVITGVSLINADWMITVKGGVDFYNEGLTTYAPGPQFLTSINYLF